MRWLPSLPFFLVQASAVVSVVWLGWSWKGFALAVALYYVRMFGITAGYHRYFSHRSYRTSRWFQFVLGVLGSTAAQKGCLWWAGHHRWHHKHSDTPQDVHSAKQHGFLWSHVGWIISDKWEQTDFDRMKDLAKYPELRWLNKRWYVPVLAMIGGLFAAWGIKGFVWGFLVSTTLLWHGTFTVNSLTHLWGRRRYNTTDDSRNSFLIALITCGEGWHNNHHHYQRSERQGFYWWELDLSHYGLKLLSLLGLVWDLHEPSRELRDARDAAPAPEPIAPAAPLVPPSVQGI
jgi:stearoyl-CoA desaturase (delta-9 desaturase)